MVRTEVPLSCPNLEQHTMMDSSPASGWNVTEIRKVVRKLLKAGEFPVYQTQDDNGLDEDEYVEFALAVFHSLPRPDSLHSAARVEANAVAEIRGYIKGCADTCRVILDAMTRARVWTAHHFTEVRSPTNIQLRCSCGWVCQITRRQNALARAAKVRAAIQRHLDEVTKEEDRR